jgi:RNA polymerase sigma-70 factor, ECF subfamily
MEFMAVYDQYYQKVRKFIQHTVKNEWVTDDLLQDTFIKAQHSLESVREASKVQAWLFRIAYNVCQDYFRSQKKGLLPTGEISEATAPGAIPATLKKLEGFQMKQCVFGLVNHLPQSLRSVIILSDVNEFSHQEIADILELTVTNVKTRLHRARKQLKALLEEHCVFEVDERNVLTCQPEKTDLQKLLAKPVRS